MAKIPAFPSMDIIAGFKGTLDFYTWKGLKIVRKWPVITGHRSTPREAANQSQFRYFQKSLKAVKFHNRHLWRSTARLANWRWHELAYRWYKGGHLGSLFEDGSPFYPRLKPWPDPLNRSWFHHVAHWIYRDGDLWLVFWLDRPIFNMTLITSPRQPLLNEVTRTERGVTKVCGDEPVRWVGERYHTMSSGFWNETPVVTHALQLPDVELPIHKHLYAQLVGQRGLEFPGTPYFETVYDYSSGPIFRLHLDNLDGAADDGTWYARPVDPAFPLDPIDVRLRFHRYNRQWRSWRWPIVRLPENSDIALHTPYPLEDFPPAGRLPA